MDICDIRQANGQPLTPKMRLDTYKAMEQIANIQHGDLISWIKDGQTLFDDKNELINNHSTGRTPLFQASPDGEYATTINKADSYFNTKSGSSWVYFDGGYKQPCPQVYSFGPMIFKDTGIPNPVPYFAPNYWIVNDGQQPATGSNGLPTSNVNANFSNSPNAKVLQPNDNGQLQSWDPANGWQPVTINPGGGSDLRRESATGFPQRLPTTPTRPNAFCSRHYL